MTDAARYNEGRRGVAEVTYRLPAHASAVVSVGATVNAGDAIATFPSLPVVVALADGLRLGYAEASSLIETLGGTAIEEGHVIASHRSGLRKRSIRAPINGTINVLTASGALFIQPTDGRIAARALHRGNVLAVEQDAITIATRVHRIETAISAGPAWRSASLPGSGGVEVLRNDSTPAAIIVAYVDNVATLAADRRDAARPVIVGTVSDEVAWAVLTRKDEARDRDWGMRPVVVLHGPGDAARGERAIRPLLDLPGRLIVIDHMSRDLTIFLDELPESDSVESTEFARGGAEVRVDPAHWHEACTVDGPPRMATLETGWRTLVARITSGNNLDERTPVRNIASEGFPSA